MAEKYELTINVQSSDTSESVDTSSPRGKAKANKDRTSGTFARPRTRDRRFSMDVFDSLKDSLGEGAYKRTMKRTQGNTVRAKQSQFAWGYGVNTLTNIASNLISTTASNIGTFTSNDAMQNTVDNFANAGKEALTIAGTIGAGAAAGGWVGAVIATVAVTAEKALDVATAGLKLAKENIKRNEDSNRIRDRLGQIETGYSR